MHDYTNIVKHYEKCLEKYGDSHLGVDWPNREDAEKRYNIMLKLCEKQGSSVLDFGCGLSHFYEYILKTNKNLKYYGLDLSEKFIQASMKKYPNNVYYCFDALNEDLQNFDYIIANGVFTEKRELSFEEMFEYFQKLVNKLYNHCNIGLAFNVMSKNVEWEREDLFHLSFDKLADFLCNNISRNFVFNNNYGLYEYTTYIYR